MILSYILLFVLLSLPAIMLSLFFVYMFDAVIRGHDLPTSKRATKVLAEIILKHKPDAKNFYDLGCAHGTLSLRLKKLLPSLDVHGVDISPVRIFFAKMKSKILRREVNFQKGDIFQTDLSDADVVYAYLWYDIMPILKKKVQKELRQGSVVITNTSHFTNWQPMEKIETYSKIPKTPDFETLFVYVKR